MCIFIYVYICNNSCIWRHKAGVCEMRKEIEHVWVHLGAWSCDIWHGSLIKYNMYVIQYVIQYVIRLVHALLLCDMLFILCDMWNDSRIEYNGRRYSFYVIRYGTVLCHVICDASRDVCNVYPGNNVYDRGGIWLRKSETTLSCDTIYIHIYIHIYIYK